MWVEKLNASYTLYHALSSSLWGCELKNILHIGFSHHCMSSSLWGCELKRIRLSLITRIGWSSSLWGCELKICPFAEFSKSLAHPPCEDVSWKVPIPDKLRDVLSHPPCEDVSWKSKHKTGTSGNVVILLVRMWVEKLTSSTKHSTNMSSSLWGCELKKVFRSERRYTGSVILLVRMWVEKNFNNVKKTFLTGHPPCEDVSWKEKNIPIKSMNVVILLVRMWVEKTLIQITQFQYTVILLVRMWVENLIEIYKR